MSVRVWEYLDELKDEREEVMEAINTVLDSGWLILGKHVSTFEEEFSKYCDSKYGIGVGNGTDSLFLGLKALGIKEGDEVITVSNTAVPTVSAIVSAGAIPRYVDIDPETYLMDVDQLESVVNEKTRGIIPVHLFGQCVNMDKINEVAKKHNLVVMEDVAQAHGAEFKGQKAGSMSDLSSFSFYPTKILGTYGDGGMVVTSNEDLFNKMKRLRFYGMEKTYDAIEHGYNSRLDELHAAILINKLKHLDKYVDRRRELANIYDNELKDLDLILPKTAPDNKHAYYIYVCRHPDRDQIIEKLREKEVFCNISYPYPIHGMEAYKHYGPELGSLPETEKAAKEIFSIPMFPSLSNERQEKVIQALREVLK